MRSPGPDGKATNYQILKRLADRGDTASQRELDDMPDPPASLRYLWEHALFLDRTRKFGTNGWEGLDWPVLYSWMQAMSVDLSATEIEILFSLDPLLLHPE